MSNSRPISDQKKKELQNWFNSIIIHPINLGKAPAILEYTNPCMIPKQNRYSLAESEKEEWLFV